MVTRAEMELRRIRAWVYASPTRTETCVYVAVIATVAALVAVLALVVW